MLLKYILIMIMISCQLFALDVGERLKQIPFRERIYLEHFFKQKIEKSHLGYVLFFSNKAIALGPIHTNRSSEYFPYTAADKGWLIWKKYEHLFPHPNFIFCEEKKRNPNYFHLIVINKTTLRNTASEHEEKFKAILDPMYSSLFKESFSPDLFVKKIEKCKFLKPLILGDDTLLGLLLGYGKDSSVGIKKYKERQAGEHWEYIPEIKKSMIIHGKGGKTYVKTFGIHPVAWSGDPESEEVQNLAQTYEKQCIELRRMFRRKSCLKPVLEALCAP